MRSHAVLETLPLNGVRESLAIMGNVTQLGIRRASGAFRRALIRECNILLIGKNRIVIIS
jgi:hypothetical protein